MIMTSVPLTPVINQKDAYILQLNVMIMMNVPLILVNLNLDVSSTGMFIVMMIISVQKMNAYLLLDVLIPKLSAMIIMLALMIPVTLKLDVPIPRLLAMITTHVLMIPAVLKMDVPILLNKPMIRTHVLLINVKMER
jgi:hypothetical protein